MAEVAQLTPQTRSSRNAASGRDLEITMRLNSLLISIGQGDRSAFRRFYDLTSRRVFGIIVAVMGNNATAEEVAQEVYVQIWRRAPDLGEVPDNPLAWISAVARNKAIDRLRAERARGFVSYTDDVPDIAGDHSEEAARVDAITIRAALGTLRPDYRKVILLSYFRGYSQSELAEMLGLPLGTVKSWMNRGMQELREALK